MVGANGLELATSRLGWNVQRRTEPAYQAHIHPKLSQCTKTLTPLPITSSCGSTTSITRTPSIPGKKSSNNSTMHIYNGAVATQTFLTMWESRKGKIDDECYNHIHYRQMFQAGHFIVWRDVINDFYWNVSEIPDEAKRVGNHSWRVEAESMDLTGYKIVPVNPFETASNYTTIITSSNAAAGTATTKLDFPSGTYNLAVNCFNLIGGRVHWEVFLNDHALGAWTGNH